MPVIFSRSSRRLDLAATTFDALTRRPLDPGDGDRAHVALVVVHGMGRQRKGETLLEWAEPIATRLHELSRRGEDGSTTAGVVIRDVVINGEGESRVVVDVTMPTEEGYRTRRVRITEARWSEAFIAMTNAEVFHWGAGFVWKASGRMVLHFSRTVFLAPVSELWSMMRPTLPATSTAPAESARTSPVRRVLRQVASAVALLFVGPLTGAIVVAMAVVVLLIAILVSVLLPLFSVLLLSPGISTLLRPLVEILVEFVGDVGVWREKPLRAMAMRQIVHEEIVKARTSLIDDDPVLAVLAHSQGAAVAARVLFRDYDHTATPHVTSFTTVGAAVMLLGNTRWSTGDTSTFTPVAEWLCVKPALTWRNYWAIWDPFSAGPIADSSRGRLSRWRLAYGHRPRVEVPGPSEHPVHNTAQPFTDHQTYPRNIVQVVDPVARELVGLPPAEPDRSRTTNRSHVRSVKSRGVLSLSGVVLAAVVQFSPSARGAVAGWIQWLDARLDDLFRWVSSFTPEPVGTDVSLGVLTTTGPTAGLTGWGRLVTAVVVVALVVWVANLLRAWVRRKLERKDDAGGTSMVIIIEAAVRLFVLVLIAWVLRDQILAAGDRLQAWATPVLFGTLALIGLSAFLSPFFARVPSIVPEERPSAPSC